LKNTAGDGFGFMHTYNKTLSLSWSFTTFISRDYYENLSLPDTSILYRPVGTSLKFALPRGSV